MGEGPSKAIVSERRKRGRPKRSSPKREKVIEIAMRWVEQGYPVHKAVRLVIDVLDYFGDVSVDGPPVMPGGTGLVRKSSRLSVDQAAIEAHVATGPDDPPPWPEARLHSRAIEVEHIAATIRRRLRAAKGGGNV